MKHPADLPVGIAYHGYMHRILGRVVDVRPSEVKAMLMSFAYFFLVLCSWFILRPIRDATAAASGASQLPWLFAGTLTVTLLLNPVLSALVVRQPVRRFIAITYHFFIVNLLGFYLLLRFVASREGTAADLWIGRAFFVWTSVFTLFVVTVFWCFMADVFRSEQGRRLFGFIGVGGTAGSICGSAATAALAPRIGAVNLLLLSAALLELAVITVMRFPARPAGDFAGGLTPGGGQQAATPAELDRIPIGGSTWAAFTHVARSPYLMGISAFLVLFTLGSTILYFQQSEIVGRTFADRAARTTVLAQLELAVQVLTVVTQLFFTGRIIRAIGLAGALAFLPAITILGFGALAAVPVFLALAAFTILRRAGNFALNNPAMEVLFTVLSREDKYKAKSFIETFVYRGGDQIAAWTYAGLTALGLSLSGIAIAAVPMAALWLALGVWLGRRQATLAGDRLPSQPLRPNPVPADQTISGAAP